MDKTYYITTPLYYVNDLPHIGHAYTQIAADALARFTRLKGKEVFLLTGTDEHGGKIEAEAASRNILAQKLADEMVERFKSLWEKLYISYDDFIRTTQARHIEVVQEFFKKLSRAGYIYKGKYRGWYCTPCESFWKELQLEEEKCPQCRRKVEKIEEESYFFKLSAFSKSLLEHYEKNPQFIHPLSRKKEMINFVKEGLEDLSVSRKSVSWGIPVPGDSQWTLWVWLDALLNYISAIGYADDKEKFRSLWPADVHFIGKDILRFHALIWPALLLAAGLPLPKRIFAHGWWLFAGRKMSKSLGNIVDPFFLVEKYGADSLRYFLLREVPFGHDGDFSLAALEKRINSDLSNDLGNLFNRSLPLIEKYCAAVVPKPAGTRKIEEDLIDFALKTPEKVEQAMEDLSFSLALEAIIDLAKKTNKYIDESQPWRLKKENSAYLGTVLYTIMEILRMLAILTSPFMPVKAKEMWRQIGLQKIIPAKEKEFPQNYAHLKQWGLYPASTHIMPARPLFPRLDTKK